MNVKYIIRAHESRMLWVGQHIMPILPDAVIIDDDINDSMADALRDVTGGIMSPLEEDGCLATVVKSLLESLDAPTVVLEDDVALTSGFTNKIEAAIKDKGDFVINFFSMRKADTTEGSRFLNGSSFCMAQCVYTPPSIAQDILDYLPKWLDEKYRYGVSDNLHMDFMAYKKMKYWNYVPSLVQHTKVKSIVNSSRSRFRQSQTFEP